MTNAEFYLFDLKSKFNKINQEEYFFIYNPDNKYNKLLFWFIKKYYNKIEIIMDVTKIDKLPKKKEVKCNRVKPKACFIKNNFYPLHDLTGELGEEIFKMLGSEIYVD